VARWQVLPGHVLEWLRKLQDDSVNIIFTSPPYWAMRDFGLPPTIWGDGWKGCLGLEPTLDLFIAHLVEIFAESRRVLHPSGTLWVDMGDSYFDGKLKGAGLKAKDLMGVPWRLALALQKDGWWLRNDIIWCKALDRSRQERQAQAEVEQALSFVRQAASGSLFGLDTDTDKALKRAEKAVARLVMAGGAMPGSQLDRCTMTHEYLMVCSKSDRYYWDRQAIRDDGRGALTVWRVPPETHKPYILPGGEEVAHFATFPRALPDRAIRAGTSRHGVCSGCGAPYERIIKPSPEYAKLLGRDWADYEQDAKEGRGHSVSGQRTTKRGQAATAEYITTGWKPTCECQGQEIKRPVVMDIFAGTGQTLLAGLDQDCDVIGIDLSEQYCRLSNARCEAWPEALPERR